MKHFLAYGNSDQVSFRDPRVRDSLNYMTVPGTIAAYYPDATAAFVLSSDLDYVIDPRTPLFQGRIDQPKASHYSLANLLGPSVAERMGEPSARSSVQFDSAMFGEDFVNELTRSVVDFQRNYGRRAANIQAQLDRYRRLVTEATGNASQRPANVKPPSFVLAPYFAAASIADDWWRINEQIWRACARLENPRGITPVLAVDGYPGVTEAFARIPTNLSDYSFFWIAGFDEREASVDELRLVWNTVLFASRTHKLVNLYGGFFSACLGYAGLWGFSNGLGYSESRDWPELPATGAAPARYYIPGLHVFTAPATAQLVIENEPVFVCLCPICSQRANAIAGLTYHELKAHFALARHQEIRLVADTAKETLADQLDQAAARFDSLKRRLPRIPITTDFLTRWATVLRDLPARVG